MSAPKYIKFIKPGTEEHYDVEDMISHGLNQFKGWNCRAGKESLYIDYDGSVWIANCAGSRANPNFLHPGYKEMFGYVGSIMEDQYQWPKSDVVCPYQYCGCGADIPVTKSTQDQSVSRNILWPKFVQWDLGRWCNYSCSYCWEWVHNKTDPHKTLSVMKQAVDRLHAEWSQGQQVRWSFGGGEPTVNPEFLDLVEYLKSRGDLVSLVTNGSRSEDYYHRLAAACDSIQFSLHFEFWKRDVFERNIHAVLKDFQARRSGWLEVKIMTKPGSVAEARQLQDHFNSVISSYRVSDRWFGYSVVVPLRDLEDGSKMLVYSAEELRLLGS